MGFSLKANYMADGWVRILSASAEVIFPPLELLLVSGVFHLALGLVEKIHPVAEHFAGRPAELKGPLAQKDFYTSLALLGPFRGRMLRRKRQKQRLEPVHIGPQCQALEAGEGAPHVRYCPNMARIAIYYERNLLGLKGSAT